MILERPLQVAIVVIATLGTVMLGVSEEHYGLAVAALVVGVTSFWFCDVLGWIELNTWAANLGALAALVVAGYQFNALSNEARILALADLMGYLQFVLLFKAKTIRNYWLLAVVSFLQVSVAAALNTGLVFAVMLATYLIAGVFFLGLFYLYRESQRAVDSAQVGSAGVGGALPLGLYARGPQAPPQAMIGDFTQRLTIMILGTVALAVLFFAAVPRIGQANWVPPGIVASRTVGFAPEMNLTRSGEIVADPELVMQVRFFDAATGEPYQVDGEPYLRGTSVSYYSGGRWSNRPFSRNPNSVRPLPAAARGGLVRQSTLIEPLSSNTVFASAPAFSNEANDLLRYFPFIGRIDRLESYSSRRFSYELVTTGFRRHRQLDLIPQWENLPSFHTLLQLPPPDLQGDPLERLKQTAAAVVAGIPATEPYRRAKALEAYLRDSGQFQYTLDTPETPGGVDPLDEFTAVHKRGHCELFAGALALMLRSVDVPARVVLGYRGGEYNVVGNFYTVRQLHAHSWVEAYLPPGTVPTSRLAVFDIDSDVGNEETNGLVAATQRYGAWLQLDPTTSDGSTQGLAAESNWGEVQQVLDYLRFLWSNYVVGMDSEKQRESVYQPFRQWVQETMQSLTQAEAWRNRGEALLYYADPRHWLPDGVPLFSVRGGLLIAGFLACAWSIGGVIYYRLRRRKLRQATAAAKRVRKVPPPVDFYVQLETALRSRNLTRTPEQTPREFVVAACGELAELPATRSVAGLPRKIVEAFYRVRFGGRPLSEAERAEIDSALAQLSAALTPPQAATNTG